MDDENRVCLDLPLEDDPLLLAVTAEGSLALLVPLHLEGGILTTGPSPDPQLVDEEVRSTEDLLPRLEEGMKRNTPPAEGRHHLQGIEGM
jgi:hypothetical protein